MPERRALDLYALLGHALTQLGQAQIGLGLNPAAYERFQVGDA